MFNKDLYFVCHTNIFCVKCISEMRHIFFIFSFIFFSAKKVFFRKKNFNYKTFFHIKTFFSANNVYFVKNTNI